MSLLHLVNLFMEYFQRKEFELFSCHLEKLGLVAFIFAAIHSNLEQALGWVTIPARIRKVGIGHLDRIYGVTHHGQVPNRQHLLC
jgi:hypothetical protein